MSSLFSRVYYQTLKDYAYYFHNLNFVLHSVIYCYILFIGGRDMHIIINHSSMIPIYEQIVEAIKEAILSNQLSPNEALPSVRALSKELKSTNSIKAYKLFLATFVALFPYLFTIFITSLLEKSKLFKNMIVSSVS